MEMHGHFCCPRAYEFEGVKFEEHSYCGPWPLCKNGEPRKRAGQKFYDLYTRFRALSEEEQEKHFVSGGCVSF